VEFVRLIILGVVIGSNNLAAGLALGALGQIPRLWRVVLVFGAFEFSIPLVGMWIGRASSRWIYDQAGWLSILLLVAVGIYVIVAALRESADEKLARRATTWGGLALLAAGLSIDNLIIGFSLGLRAYEPLTIAATIALFSMAFTAAGMKAGDVSRRRWERTVGVVAGALLLAVAALEAFGVL
jgi:putative Mn2+ efflux pump MntP